MKKLRIGLLGGSFNPAHAGHRDISLHALRQLQLDQVWWLVSPQNPLKSKKGMAPLTQRINQARAIARHPKIKITDFETKFSTRYTVDTLVQLKQHFPHTYFVWLMGADNMKQLPRWKQWAKIFTLVPVAVFRRPNYVAGRNVGKVALRFSRFWQPTKNAKNLAIQPTPAWLVLDNKLNSLSATALRHKQ